MADDNDASSKTEEPTPRKLEEARRRGEVAKSQDLPSWAALAASWGVIAVAGGWLIRDLAAQLVPFVAHPETFDLSGTGGVAVMKRALNAALPVMAAVLAATAVAGAAGNVVQHGFLWSPDRMKPELKKLNPLEGFKRLFGLDGVVQFIKSLLKIVLVSAVAWMVMKPHAGELAGLAAMDPLAMLPYAGDVVRALFFGVLALLGAGALLDWIWQRQRFMQRMRMTKEELKEDHKQSEGDPHIKAKLRQLRVERSRRWMMQNVPKATVVVMNPTHYAVALRYEAGETAAPVCVAKGLDSLALKIRAVAEEAGVTVVEDPPLARALYAAVEIDETIPAEHFQAVAKIIGFILNAAKPRPSARPL